MKTAVVYYSYDGSTRVAAEVMAERMNADIFELEEMKARSHKASGFMSAGFAALMGMRSRLKTTFANKMAEYTRIYIGTPIWASQCAPAVNAFVRAADLSGKDVAVFTLQADRSPDKANGAQRLIKHLEKKGAIVADFIRLVGAPPGQTAAREDVMAQLDAHAPKGSDEKR
jgi:flavodoxin